MPIIITPIQKKNSNHFVLVTSSSSGSELSESNFLFAIKHAEYQLDGSNYKKHHGALLSDGEKLLVRISRQLCQTKAKLYNGMSFQVSVQTL